METTYHGYVAIFCSKANTFFRESRYLLFLTQNYSSLQVLKHYIVTKCLQDSNSSLEGSHQVAEPFVLFGSSFPKDKEFAQVKIFILVMVCMLKNYIIGLQKH